MTADRKAAAAGVPDDKPAPPNVRDVRSRILGAAFGVLRERGYAQTSTNEIAARARVSKRELYSEFGSKQGILEAMIASRAARMRRPLEAIEVADRTALAATLNRFGGALLSELHDPAVIAMFRLAISAAESSPEMSRVIDATAREPTRQALIKLLERARAASLVTGEPAAMTQRLQSLLLGHGHVSLLLGLAAPLKPAEIDRHVADVVEAFLQLYGEPAKRTGKPISKPRAASRRPA
jgi:AcrR family transcriptional regulator